MPNLFFSPKRIFCVSLNPHSKKCLEMIDTSKRCWIFKVEDSRTHFIFVALYPSRPNRILSIAKLPTLFEVPDKHWFKLNFPLLDYSCKIVRLCLYICQAELSILYSYIFIRNVFVCILRHTVSTFVTHLRVPILVFIFLYIC